MEIQLQQRLIKYAMANMREQIHTMQIKIATLSAQLQHFPNSALSDFGVRLGAPKGLAYEAEGAASELNDAQLRLNVLVSDYNTTQALWQEFKDQSDEAMIRAFWKNAK